MAGASQTTSQRDFVDRMPEVAAARVLVLIRQENLTAATRLAETHELPISQARVRLAQGDPSGALAVLEPWRRQAEANAWEDERLKAMVLQAVLHNAHCEDGEAVRLLGEALTLAEPESFTRTFVDEGKPMAALLSEAVARGVMPDYARKLMDAIDAGTMESEDGSYQPTTESFVEPLSQRELEVLRLIAQGLSNREIGERLFLALDTVKGHNRRIFGKLLVQRRTEAVAKARSLGILPRQN